MTLQPRTAASHGILPLLALGVVLLLGFLLRVHEADRFGISFDESFVWKMTQFSWGEMWQRIPQDTHPPLFYLLLKLARSLGVDSLGLARMYCAMWGTGSVAALYWCTLLLTEHESRWRRYGPALLAAFLLAISPFHIHWTSQVRMYGQGTTLSIASCGCLLQALGSSSRRSWLLYGAASLASLYTHYLGLFILCAQILAVVLFMRPKWREMGTAVGGIALGFAPWVPLFWRQRQLVSNDFYIPQLTWEHWGKAVHECWQGVSIAPSETEGIVLTLMCLLCLSTLQPQRNSQQGLLTLAVLAPALGLIGSSMTGRPVVTARYLLFSYVYVLSALSILVCRLTQSFAVFSGALLCVYLGLGSCHYLAWKEQMSALPGLREAVVHAEGQDCCRPLLVANPMLFTTAVSLSANPDKVYYYQPRQAFPFYFGTAVLRKDEAVTDDWFSQQRPEAFWTLDADQNMGRVPVPGAWKLVTELQFPEWYAGDLTLRYYVGRWGPYEE